MESFEYEVAQILLELPNLISKSEAASQCRLKFSVKWGAIGKRSAVAAPNPSMASESETEKEKHHMALSPTSPFLFPHETTKQHRKIKISLKRKTEQFLKMGDELTESNRIFKEEIKKRKISTYDQLKALNLRLIEAVKESESTLKNQLSFNHAMESTSTQQPSEYMANQQPFVMDQTAHSIETSSRYPHGETQNLSSLPSNGGGLSLMINDNNKKVGPFLLPDINVPLEEEEESFMTESRALAAHARQRRIQILRSKATNKLPKSRFCR